MVNIPPIKMVNLGDGLWYCFTRITMIWRGRRTIILQQWEMRSSTRYPHAGSGVTKTGALKRGATTPWNLCFLLSIER